MPDRENYGGNSRYIVKRYLSHIVRMFMLAGDTLERAEKEAAAVLGIETALAQASTNRAESADPEKRYHVLTLADLEKLAPDFDFSVYFKHVNALPIETLNVANRDFLKTVNRLITSVPVDSWRSYFTEPGIAWPDVPRRRATAAPGTPDATAVTNITGRADSPRVPPPVETRQSRSANPQLHGQVPQARRKVFRSVVLTWDWNAPALPRNPRIASLVRTPKCCECG